MHFGVGKTLGSYKLTPYPKYRIRSLTSNFVSHVAVLPTSSARDFYSKLPMQIPCYKGNKNNNI